MKRINPDLSLGSLSDGDTRNLYLSFEETKDEGLCSRQARPIQMVGAGVLASNVRMGAIFRDIRSGTRLC